MLKSLKKLAIGTGAVCFLACQTLTTPAHAIVAVASWNPLLMGYSLAATCSALVVGEGVDAVLGHFGASEEVREGNAIFTGIIGMFGVIALDGQAGQQLSFVELSDAQAKKLNISKAERLSYNSELDQINAIAANVSITLSKTSKVDVREGARVWEQYENLVSQDSFTAMQKIAVQMVRK